MKSKIANISRTALRYLGVFLCMVMIFSILSTIAYSIPSSSSVRENICRSKGILASESKYPSLFLSLEMKDNFTDNKMLQIAEFDEPGSSSGNPFVNALLNQYHYYGHPGVKEDIVTYARYWHGYLVPLKLQLTYTDIAGIRITNILFLSFLLIASVALLRKKVGIRTASMFAFSILLTGVPLVPVCMQFSTCYYITLISVIAILTFPRLTAGLSGITITLFIIGGITSYMDFLTVPMMTLGFPLAVVFMQKPEKCRIRILIYASIAWMAGYGGIWASKWILTSAITEFNVINDALNSINVHTSVNTTSNATIIKIFILVITFAIIDFSACLTFKKNNLVLKRYIPLVIIGCLPIIWYLVLWTHTMNHYWFTWRALSLLIFCWGLYGLMTVDFKRITHLHINGA